MNLSATFLQSSLVQKDLIIQPQNPTGIYHEILLTSLGHEPRVSTSLVFLSCISKARQRVRIGSCFAPNEH